MNTLLTSLLATATLLPLPHHRNLRTLSIGTERPRTMFMAWPDCSAGQSLRYEDSPWHQSLNGKWHFFYADDDHLLPHDATADQPDTQGWSTISVPGNWEMQGFGTAIYVNQPYEFVQGRPQPPVLPDEIPVGVYQRSFTVPDAWEGKNVFLHIDGAKSGVYVYLNGQHIGYSEDSKSTVEYLLNPHLRKGENHLTLKIYRWSTGSYLECQDFWRISGIERDVWLSAEPQVSVRDFHITSTLDDSYRDGIFRLQTELRNTTGKRQRTTVSYELRSDNGGTIVAASSQSIDIKDTAAFADFSATIPNVRPWSSEQPQLYTLYVKVQNGKEQEVIPYRVGFRRIEIKERLCKDGRTLPCLLVNGQPIKLKGVNIHEHNPYTGHYVTEEVMRRDFELMRRNNINAVRLSHYPQGHRFYELASEYGLYVYDEANIESHGMGYDLRKGGTLGNNPDWLEAHLYRTRNLYEHDKNYPCVCFWSLGNEAGNGVNFYETYQWLKAADAPWMSRPVSYERALLEWNTDLFVPQYPSAEWFAKVGKSGLDRPVIPSEYAHAMGNSTGDLWGQWQPIYEYDHLQGGFIWDWVDQGILALHPKDSTRWGNAIPLMDQKRGQIARPNSEKFYAYGGDFGDRPTDREFCVDGLVLPDRRNTPKMDAVKAAYAPLKITLTDTEAVIENRNLFTDLNAYDLVFASSVNGKPERRAVLRADCKPGGTEHIPFPFALPEAGLACMTVTAIQRAALPGIPAGYEAALGQVWHNYAVARLTLPAPQLVEMDCNVGVKGEGFEYIFGRGKGLVSIRYNGVQLLDDTVRPNFWRAPTNNDEGCAEPFTFAFWKTAGLYARCDNLTAETKGDFVIARANYTLPDGQTLPIDFAIDGAGRCDITMTWQGTRTELPEFGLLFPLRRELTEVSYLGLGPRETTADRTAGGKMGAWNYNVRQDFAQNSPVYPQECGSRTGVYSATVTGSGLNIGIGFAGDGMTFSALPYTPHELENARHLYELPRDDNKTVVRCAAFQRGVGGDNSWGAKPHADACFAVEKGTSFRFTIQK